MKDAHRIYKNDFQRRGRTWSEVGYFMLGKKCC